MMVVKAGIIRRRTGSATVVEINRHAAEWWLNFDFVSSHALALVSSVSEKVNQKITDFDYSQSLIQQVFENPIGIPYLETPWLQEVLTDYHQASRHSLTIQDLISALSLSRPGVSQSLGKYLDRLSRTSASEKSPLLSETFGLILYQEQVLEVATKMAAFTGPDAEALRRAISKERQPHKITALKNKFITGSVKNGHGQADAQKYFDMISHFAEYGFLRGHALALINNICLPAAYLKFNYPDAFFSTLLEQGTSFYCWSRQQKI